MYIPPHFREDDIEVLHDFIRAHPLATLVTQSSAGLDANEIPLLLLPGGVLRGHVSRANPIWHEAAPAALAIFKGADAYISPSWYPSKQEHGLVVPTWNYSVVHAHGTLAFFDDKMRLREIVDELTRTHEAQFTEPWHTTDAPPGYIDGLLSAIVGFDLNVSRLEAKFKQSQNRPEADREAVRKRLS